MGNGKIVTVTLNPSLDKTLITHHLNIGYHNRVAETTHLDASGRGVNVSRALNRLGIATHAIVLLGDDAIGRAYRGLLREEAFPSTFVIQTGPMRSDTIIVNRGDGTETHIIDEGAGGSQEVIQQVTEKLVTVLEPGDRVVFAGDLPRDASSESYLRMSEAAFEAGGQVILMAGGDAFSQALRAQPALTVLTRLEAEALFNYPVRTDADMISGCQKLRELGAAEALIVTEDYSRAVLTTGEDTWLTEIAETGPGTDSGVVDALLAGYLAGLSQGMTANEALRLGAAAMNYADSQIGNEFGSLDQIRQLLHRVDVRLFEKDDKPPLASAGA